MADKIYLYPVWVRMWHALNAILCLLLIITGLSMQYSTSDYTFIGFKWAVSIHDFAGILLALNYIYYLFSNRYTQNIKHYKFSPKGLANRLGQQLRYYVIGYFRKENPPFPITEEQKFNPLQKFSYIVVMYFLIPVMVITGIGLLFPTIVLHRFFRESGLHITDMIHTIAGFLISIFLLIHLYCSTLGQTPTSYFKSMITGWHEKH